MTRARWVRWAIAFVGMVALIAATAVGVSARGTGSARPTAETLTMAFIHNGPVSDQGWSQSHHQSRLAMEKALKGRVKTSFVENVPYGKKASDLWEQLAARKVSVIVDATAAGPSFVTFCRKHQELQCATTYPPLSPNQPKNLTNFYVQHWVGSYLAGVAAGLLTKKGTLGYVAPFKVPTVNAALNSFTLGCQSVRKNCTVKTVVTNSWYDPPKETEAAQTLVNGGADIMNGLTDDPAYSTVAAKSNLWTIGSYQYAYAAASKWWIAGVIWDWTKMYIDYARGLLAGTWIAHTVIAPSGLSPWGRAVPASVKAKVEKVRKQIVAGKNVFVGPIYDNNGKLRVKAGQSLSPAFLLNSWTWLVKGVVSS